MFSDAIPQPNVDDVDAALMAVVGPRWRKVARIAADAVVSLVLRCGSSRLWWPGGHDDFDPLLDLVLARIAALAEVGRVETVGNVQWPRFSEVKLPDDATVELPIEG